LRLEPSDVGRRPFGDLIEMPDAHGVQFFSELICYAPNQTQIIAFAIARRGQQFRFGVARSSAAAKLRRAQHGRRFHLFQFIGRQRLAVTAHVQFLDETGVGHGRQCSRMDSRSSRPERPQAPKLPQR
jgi:hypothetical protein